MFRQDFLCAHRLGIIALFFILQAVAGQPSRGDDSPPYLQQGSALGFGALAMITTSENWQQIWAQPSRNVSFEFADSIPLGKKSYLLVLFSNPLLEGGQAKILCDFEFIAPDGSLVNKTEPSVCFESGLSGPLTDLYLTEHTGVVYGETNEEAGIYTVNVGVKDENRGIRILLTVQIEVVGSN